MDLTVIAQRVEVVEQRGPAAAIAELEVGPNAVGLVDIVAVVTLCQILGGIVGGPGPVNVVQNLIASGCLRKPRGLCLKSRALLFALIAVEDAQRDGNLESDAVVNADAFVFAAKGGIGGGVSVSQFHVGIGQSDGLAGGEIVGTSGERLLLDLVARWGNIWGGGRA